MRPVTLALCICLLLLSCPALECQAASDEKPLPLEGKTSVFQRLVTHPGARLYSGPEAGAGIVRDPVKTFTVMYIYGREGDRIKVGSASDRADGWIDAKMATEWPQALTMLFTDRTGRDPVLFFRDHQSLEDTCKAEDIGAILKGYAADLAAGRNKPDSPVVASEPPQAAVAEKNFYLLPVLNVDDQFHELNGPRLIEVASINPGSGAAGGEQEKAMPAGGELRTGFAFVIDTTISMKPYIDQTVRLVRELYDELEKSPHADKMSFAVVAFRNSTRRTPGLDYTAEVVCDFTPVSNREALESALAKVQEARISTHEINEDSFAGVKEAVDSLSWQNFGSRVMLLATDAGPLGAGDPDSATGFSPETLADYLRQHKIYLTALHIMNPRSASNHQYARKAYQTLTRQSDNQASYIAIEAETPAQGARAFDRVTRQLAKSYGDVLAATAEGKFISRSETPRGRAPSPEDEARRIAESTGYAMQLQFFGNRAAVEAPEVVRAWIADADMAKLASGNGEAPVLAVEPAVLLTKGQLSNLYRQIKLVLSASEQAFLNGDADLFDHILSASAQLSRDPGQFSLHPDRNLAENGLLDEVLEGLPYRSVTGSMTRKDWEDMSTGQRDAFIKRLKGLLARYEAYDRDASHWESFGSDNPNDRVYRVPLSMLP